MSKYKRFGLQLQSFELIFVFLEILLNSKAFRFKNSMLRRQKTLGRSKHRSVCFVKSTTAGKFIHGKVTTTVYKKKLP